jgi:hypothetical protein
MAKSNLRKAVKNILIVIVVLLIFIQFIHPKKNTDPVITPQDIAVMYPLPDSIHLILQKACYDCHSNTTRYPWYNNVQPVAFWLNHHINEGKEHLNFSAFGSYPKDKQIKKLKNVAHIIEESHMPLDSYLWIHKDAVLTEAERDMLIAWANGLAKRIAADSGQ